MFDDTTGIFASRGITLTTLGGAYLALLCNLAVGFACFIAARARLVISPNRATKHYGLYVVMVLATFGIATVLENELVPRGAATLQYVAIPQLLLLAVIHLWIYYDQQPWLIALGASANAGALITTAAAGVIGAPMHIAHWLMLVVLSALLGYLAKCAISTRHAFLSANSIYATSKEGLDTPVAPQTPWLGLPQWISLVAASVVLAIANAFLRGDDIANVPAVAVAGESTLMLGVTVLIGAIPAAIYWLVHKNWMPELTRFVWLVWLVVGFAFTYSNVLTSVRGA
jgi:hypothetical protein